MSEYDEYRREKAQEYWESAWEDEHSEGDEDE